MDLASYNRLGQVFCAANVSAKSVIAVTTAMTGVILANPVGSGRNFLISKVGFVWTTAPAAVHNLAIALAAPTTTAPATTTAIGSGVLSAAGLGNRGASLAQAYDAATLPVAPVIVDFIGGAVYGSGVGESPYSIRADIDGGIMVPPGGVLTLAAVTTTLVGMGSISWVEVPVNP